MRKWIFIVILIFVVFIGWKGYCQINEYLEQKYLMKIFHKTGGKFISIENTKKWTDSDGRIHWPIKGYEYIPDQKDTMDLMKSSKLDYSKSPRDEKK